MTALFASIWPYILSVALAVGAILFGWFKTKQAQTNVVQIKAAALSDVDKANANAQVAIDNLNARKTADVHADADASKTAATAAQERTNVENAQAALSDDAAREQLIGLLHSSADDNRGVGKGSAGADPGRG